ATLELHWNVGGGRARHVLPAEQAWSRARRHRGGSGEFAVLAPDDAVLHAFAHTQVADRHDRLCFIGLRTIQDLAALSAHYGAELNWQNVQQAVRRSGHERELVRYLYCAWRVGGIPPPLELAFSRSDAAYLAACRASIRWSWLRRAISGAEARWYRRWHASNAAPLLAAVRPLPKGR
ncbi:MAG: nucleotidyltransferase family protein, partial [Gammaproteobacteria bacterium]|nr:nucleotidyltransferase family protein [Gammaproteobacteria bacterium]